MCNDKLRGIMPFCQQNFSDDFKFAV